MSKNAQVRCFLYAVAGLNLLVLVMVFVIPRVQFMIAHRDLTAEQLLETRGAWDMPNVSHASYEVLNRIKNLTEDSATIFLPPSENHEHRSPAIKVLYPREIFWGATDEFNSRFVEAPGENPAYLVVKPGWNPHWCKGRPDVELGLKDYKMCRLG